MASFTDRARERGVALSFTERKRNRIAEDKAEQAKRAKTLTTPQQRDQAEQARRAKMGTTKNMTEDVVTKATPPKQTFFGKAGSFAKGVITDPLGTLDRIDQSKFGKDIAAGAGDSAQAYIGAYSLLVATKYL